MARVTLVMPDWANEEGAEDEEVDSWDRLARKQLAATEATWESLEEGNILAVEFRESRNDPWPGTKLFVVILDQAVLLFDESGAVFNDEDESPDGLVKLETFNREFAGNKGDYFRIPPESSVCDPTAILPDFAAAYGAEVEAAALEQQIGMLPPGSPVQPPAREHPPAAAPSAAADFRSPLATVGARVLLGGAAAVVFRVTSKFACVAYDRLDWIAWRHADFASAATEEQEPAAEPVEDVVCHPNPKVCMPEGFLIGKHSEPGPNAWEWFDRYEPRPAHDDQRKWSQPRLPIALKAGQQVKCTGKVLATGDGPVTLIALAQAREKPPKRAPKDAKPPKLELRRSAVVAIDGKLASAQLMSAEEGCITPTSPSVIMPAAELQQLQLQVAAFLGPLNVGTLKSRLTRADLAAPPEPPEPRRSQRTASAASASPASAPSEASSTTTKACPELPFDLYRVSERTLHGFSLAQLHALCASRQLAAPPSADKLALVKALKTFQARKGRHRRNLSTPSETKKTSASSAHDSDDGEEQQQEWQPRKPEAGTGMGRHRGKHKQARPRTPSPSSSRSSSPLSPSPRPRRRKLKGTPDSISSLSTPPDVRKARTHLAEAEAARMARLQEKVDRYERKQHEKKKKHHRRKRHQ